MLRAVNKCEQGNIALYVAVLIPLILSLSVLAVDVSGYQALRETAQKEADRIALLAAQALPDTAAARRVVIQQVNSLSKLRLAQDEHGVPLIQISSSRLLLTLEGEVEALFDIFLEIVASQSQLFRVQEQSEVQLVPADYVVILADGISLRPLPGTAWGSEKDWPASKLFNFVSSPQIRFSSVSKNKDNPETYLDAWWKKFETREFRRWLTQTCYNPVYSSMKYAAIALVDFWSAGSTNRVSLIFTPGENPEQGYTVSADLQYLHPDKTAAAARWLAYSEPQTYPLITDEACLYYADPEISAQYSYVLPDPPESFGFVNTHAENCEHKFLSTVWGEPYYPFGKLHECFLNQELTLREAIYYHAARNSSHSANGENIIAAIDQAFLQLLEAGESEVRESQRIRGNLSTQALKTIILVSDLLPSPQSKRFQQALRRITENKIQLVLVPFVFPEQGNRPGINLQQGELIESVEAFAALGKTGIRIFPAHSSVELQELIIPHIVGSTRKYVIRR